MSTNSIDHELLFLTLINRSNICVFWKDINLKFLGCNDSYSKKFGIKDKEGIINKKNSDLNDPITARSLDEIEKEVIKTNEPILDIKAIYRNSTGNSELLKASIIPIAEYNNVIGILGILEEIEEKELNYNEIKDKYKNIIDFTNTGYVIMDTKLNIMESNFAFATMLGFTSDKEIIGKNLRTWIAARDIKKFDDAFTFITTENEKNGNGKKISNLELFINNEAKKNVYISIDSNVIQNGITKIFCLIRDITYKKILEDIKYIEEQKKKDRMKQDIIGIRNKIKELIRD